MKTSAVWVLPPIMVFSAFGATQGCGGDGDSQGAVASGLPADMSVATLTESDAFQLCEATASAAEATFTVNDLCTFLGAVSALTVSDTEQLSIDQAMCETARDECVTSASGAPTESNCDSGEAATTFQDCNTTVGQLEACLSAQLAFLADVLPLFTCTSVPTMQQAQNLETAAEPAECAGLSETCGDLFFDSTAPTPVEPTAPSATGCDDTCVFNNDAECDDGGPSSVTNFCGLGTDCTDCGAR